MTVEEVPAAIKMVAKELFGVWDFAKTRMELSQRMDMCWPPHANGVTGELLWSFPVRDVSQYVLKYLPTGKAIQWYTNIGTNILHNCKFQYQKENNMNAFTIYSYSMSKICAHLWNPSWKS